MRADRLVATLLVLQSRGRVTAAEVADELEVSIRTARRDLEALSIAGIPVYSQAGPGRRLVAARRRPHRPERAHRRRGPHAVPGRRAVVGGHARGEGRAAQARAGAARDVPGRGREGGVGHRARPRRAGAAPRRPPRRTSRCCSRRCSQGVQVRLGYRDRAGAVTERIVHPLGLVSKGSAWYLVADTDNGHAHVPRVAGAVGRAHRPSRCAARPTSTWPTTWQKVVAEMDERRGSARVHALADPTHPRTAPWPLRQPARGGRAHRRRPGRRSTSASPRTTTPRWSSPGTAPVSRCSSRPRCATSLGEIGALLVDRYGAA